MEPPLANGPGVERWFYYFKKGNYMESDKIYKVRHSLAHILAAVVQNKYPEAQFGVGPVISNGFYYDILLNEPLKLDNLKALEKDMQGMIADGIEFVKEDWPIDDAINYFEAQKQKYKVELLKDLKQKGTTSVADIGDNDLVETGDKITSVTIYKTGYFVDLCKVPHVRNTSESKKIVFKLNNISGAYWRGNENNDQLQRGYGVAFTTEAELSK